MSYQLYDTAYSILALGGVMSTMKLEKLVYYTNIEWLKETNDFLFPEDFQAWSVGPVCWQLFQQHRGMFAISLNDFQKNRPKTRLLEEYSLSFARQVIAEYGRLTGQELYDQFNRPGTPWKLARGTLKKWEPGTEKNMMTKQMLRSYYLN